MFFFFFAKDEEVDKISDADDDHSLNDNVATTSVDDNGATDSVDNNSVIVDYGPDNDDEIADSEPDEISDNGNDDSVSSCQVIPNKPQPVSRKTKKVSGRNIEKRKAKVPGSKKTVKKGKKPDGDPNWKEVTGNFQNPNQRKPFTESPGIKKRNADAANTPLEHFLLFFTFDIIDQIVLQTNLYYQQEKASKPSTKTFVATSREEIMAFLGMILAMGIAKLPAIADYWRKGITFMPWFSGIMFRDRFLKILKFLHLVDNSNAVPRDDPNYDKLFKLGGIHGILNQSFADIYQPTQSLSIDEQMIGTKSRVSFIQYMPKKPKKFGIKIWALCQSDTGYCIQFQIYTGKVDSGQEQGLTYRVVMDLMKNYLDKGYHIYMDNFYTHLALFKDLLARNTLACGTIKINRGEFPGWFKTQKLKHGDASYIRNNNILAVHWKDKRDVFVLSSLHGNTATEIERYSGNVVKPDCISDYNKNMGGVDKCDQLLSYYAIAKKSKKWWKKVFFRLFELCVINSMCLFMQKNEIFAKKKNSHKRYREMLIHELVQPLLQKRNDDEPVSNMGRPAHPKARGNLSDIQDDVRLRGRHYAIKKHPRRKCTMCGYKKDKTTGKRTNKRTVNYCEKCKKYVCEKCFPAFHTKSQL